MVNENLLKELEKGIFNCYGKRVVNATPHPLTMGIDAENIATIPCGAIVSAKAEDKKLVYDETRKVNIWKTVFVPDMDTQDTLVAFIASNPDVLILGSVIAMNAYAGLIFGLKPLPGYERVAPDQKRMDINNVNVG